MSKRIKLILLALALCMVACEQPDLVVDELSAPRSACVGDRIGESSSLTVANRGELPVTATFDVRWYLSEDDELDSSDERLRNGRRSISGLAPGATVDVNVDDTELPESVPAGDWHVLVVVDDSGVVSESNEGNNTRSRSLEILQGEPCSEEGDDDAPDDDEPLDGELVQGFEHLRYADDGGCVFWDVTEEEAEENGTAVDGTGDFFYPDGGAVEQEFEDAVLHPSSMCNETTLEEEALTEEGIGGEHLGPQLPHPSCTEEGGVGCPEEGTGVVEPPAYRASAQEPPNPFAAESPEEVEDECEPGFGWSFEGGSAQGWDFEWTGEQPLGPVFGNNVSIDRVRPPGFPIVERILETIGGDYWEFSRDVNQQGNWWIGTGDFRPTHLQRPGERHEEEEVGFATSPTFTMRAPYLAFWIGGTAAVTQRVELQIESNDEMDAIELDGLFDGIGTAEFPEGVEDWDRRPNPSSSWVVVRASAPQSHGEYMGRQVIWDVGEFEGRTARLLIVDEDRHIDQAIAHVNVDDFRCLSELPERAEDIGGEGKVFEVLKPQPIWGTTESHSHATANLSFGGHLIWGDVDDELRDVYSCLHDLDSIPDDAEGFGGRERIVNPAHISTCYLKLEMTAAIVAGAAGVCAVASVALTAIPIVGPLVAAAASAACTALISAAAIALPTTPVVAGHYFHGAEMPTSGAVVPGPFIQFFSTLFGSGLGRIPGVMEERDSDASGEHSGLGLGQFHNHYQKDMIRRAYEGGMRLMVIDVHNSRAMQQLLDGKDDYDDWQAIHDHVAAVERLVAPGGALGDFAAIAYTPAQAREIVEGGGMAIILGVEVMELGKLRDDIEGEDSLERQVTDLYAMGVRKITAIHGTNNPLGGTGLFQDIYQSANVFNNLTLDENGDMDGSWNPVIDPVVLSVPDEYGFPLGGLGLGNYGIGDTLQATCDDTCATCEDVECDWNQTNGALFDVTDPVSNAVLAGDTFIGGTELVNFQLGIHELGPLQPVSNPRELEPTFLGVNRAYSLSWLLGTTPVSDGRARRCSLENMAVPLPTSPSAEVVADYHSHPNSGHFNSLGLRDDGRTFLKAMMARGMLLDTDHFSQLARIDTRVETEAFVGEIGRTEYTDYPVFGVHTELRGFESLGSFPYEEEEYDAEMRPPALSYVELGGHTNENSKSQSEIDHIADTGGTITANIPGVMRDSTYGADLVNNDCDFSSKGYAWKYLVGVELMGGHGVTPGFDMNGFAPGIASRYGVGTSCRGGVEHQTGYDMIPEGGYGEGSPAMLAHWPRDWMPREDGSTFASVEECLYNGSMVPEMWNEDCPSTESIEAQMAEFSGVVYDDYFATPTSPGARPAWSEIGWLNEPQDGVVVLYAREIHEHRDDGAHRAPEVESVAVLHPDEATDFPFRQGRALRKFKNDGAAPERDPADNTGWDINLDGMQHVGMLPDLAQDMRNVGVTWEMMTPMFNAAEDYIRMWERTCDIAEQWREATGAEAMDLCGSD